MRTARASGSCSACAIRSAAIQRRVAASATMHNLARAGVEVDAAVGGDQRLGRRDVAVAGPDDLVHARHRVGAVGERGDRVRAAEPEQPRDAGFDRGGHHHRLRSRADGDDHPRTPAAAAGIAVINSDEGSG